MMACWFREDDVTSFVPVERNFTGEQLFERWGKHPGVCPEEFVRAKLRESRLLDIHPNFGGTRGSFPEQESFPPLESGLFPLSLVKEIEAKDLGIGTPLVPDAKPAGHLNHDPELQAKAHVIARDMLKKHGARYVRRDRVARELATEVLMTAETVARRIRKQW